ncbi:MATE family efflux transporter [Diplocloster agilis]|uniref:Probable multidrug resistance protein NorM n=1 Tax=Diplocloster agilis TaxID=2850323 RepID=A0A949K0G9_9FIRM|nr:MATE family efflux transporter [Diplocloster agilis]MBU9737067.1 MATE family efflux transporter [Diplocloster agilis]MBU9744234.1 MATE family efflux transporter [Diplocloster agilis]
MKNENLLTEGNVFRVLLSFSVPFLIANVIQALYGAVDLMVIGWYCPPESVAAVSTGTQVTQIITSMVSGLTLGGTILVGKYTGMRDEKRTERTIGTTLSVFAIVALVLTLVMLLLRVPVLEALKTPDASFDMAKQYVTICFCGIFFICGYNAISAILRGYGDSKRPMYFAALSCVLNIIGDVVFVKYMGMGVAGTALATVGSQAVSMVCSIIYLNRRKFIFTFRLKNFKIYPELARELAVVGIPISFQECMVRLSFLYLTSVTNRLGVSAAAAVGIASKYDVFAMLPATSLASALAAITAQNYGAGKLKRAGQSLAAGIGFAFLASSLFFLWAQISPQTMIGVFNSDPAIIEAGIPFFRSCSYDYLAVSFVFCLNGYMNGRSKTVFTMVSCCFGALALRMPLIWLAYTYCPENLAVIGAIAPAVSGFMAAYTMVFVLRQIQKDKRSRF